VNTPFVCFFITTSFHCILLGCIQGVGYFQHSSITPGILHALFFHYNTCHCKSHSIYKILRDWPVQSCSRRPTLSVIPSDTNTQISIQYQKKQNKKTLKCFPIRSEYKHRMYSLAHLSSL